MPPHGIEAGIDQTSKTACNLNRITDATSRRPRVLRIVVDHDRLVMMASIAKHQFSSKIASCRRSTTRRWIDTTTS